MIHAIPEASFLRITAAANWIPPAERADFLQAVADELARAPEIGEGSPPVLSLKPESPVGSPWWVRLRRF
jgi:hypothetical protein